MTDTDHRHLRPIRDRKALFAREAELAAAARDIDAQQRRLATEFSRLRAELATIREQLWPSDAGHAYDKTRRPPLAGPAPIPPPVTGAVPVWGRALRDAALRVLLRADAPLALAEIHRGLHLDGHVMPATDPVKQLGDALGYEERRGTVRRVARGTYVIGTLTPYRRRVLQRR
jgi:hypothetical protein